MTHSTTKHRRLTAAGYTFIKMWVKNDAATELIAATAQYAREIDIIAATDRPHISQIRRENKSK